MTILSKSWEAMDGISRYDEVTNTVEAYTPHVIPQLVGYIKFQCKDDVIVYRGQRNDYGNIIPSLYRQINPTKRKRIGKISSRNGNPMLSDYICNRKIKELQHIKQKLKESDAFIPNTDEEYFEAIMQHYGFNTRYIDFVDNIWVALVFSVLTFKLSAFRFSDELVCFDSNGYGYIYVTSLGEITSKDTHATNTSKNYEIIDLRRSLPSLYLRPHAQHGLLVRKLVQRQGKLVTMKSDMIGDVVVKIKIKKSTIIKWINNSDILSPPFLFPHMYFDHGYAMLASINMLKMFREIIADFGLKYNGPLDVYDHFGCVKAYTYEHAESDYSEYIQHNIGK